MPERINSLVFKLTFFILLLTGFAQMPVFKRYYIADIPGLGWLGQFYVTHTIHYIVAVPFIALMCYAGIMYVIKHRQSGSETVAAFIQAALLTGIIITGFLLVIRNFPGYRFSQNLIIVLDISHIVLPLAYMVTALIVMFLKMKDACQVADKKKTEPKKEYDEA